MFVCVAVGIQMIFNVGVVARVHKFVISKVRATSSSVNSMFQGLCSGIFLMIYKQLLETQLGTKGFLIFIVLFVCVIYFPLKIQGKNAGQKIKKY